MCPWGSGEGRGVIGTSTFSAPRLLILSNSKGTRKLLDFLNFLIDTLSLRTRNKSGHRSQSSQNKPGKLQTKVDPPPPNKFNQWKIKIFIVFWKYCSLLIINSDLCCYDFFFLFWFCSGYLDFVCDQVYSGYFDFEFLGLFRVPRLWVSKFVLGTKGVKVCFGYLE